MRKIALLSVKIFVSLGLLYFALRKTNFSELVSRIDATSAGWIGLAVAAVLLQVFLGAVRWREVSSYCGAPLKLVQATRFSLIGSFFNQTLPSSIGGDAVKVWLVGKDAGWRAATYSVFIDRAIGMIALAIVIVGTLPWSYFLIGDPQGRSALILADLAALAGGLVFLLLGRPRWRWLRNWRVIHHVRTCSEIANRILFGSPGAVKVAMVSMSIHVLSAVVAWCVAQSIAAPVLFSQIFQLIPPVVLITMLPVSIAGWGVREATLGLAFSYAGLIANEGINISLLFGAVYFVVGVFGGLVWICSPEKHAKFVAPPTLS